MTKNPRHLLWLDFETTGLDTGKGGDVILEIGVVVTEFAAPYKVVAEFRDVIAQLGVNWRKRLNRPDRIVVKKMHQESGLFDEVATAVVPLEHVSRGLHQFIVDLEAERGDFRLAGSGVARFDRPLIRRDFGWLDSWLTYDEFDVGNMRRLAQSAGIEIPQGFRKESIAHRSIADIHSHINEARWYAKSLIASVGVANSHLGDDEEMGGW